VPFHLDIHKVPVVRIEDIVRFISDLLFDSDLSVCAYVLYSIHFDQHEGYKDKSTE